MQKYKHTWQRVTFLDVSSVCTAAQLDQLEVIFTPSESIR